MVQWKSKNIDINIIPKYLNLKKELIISFIECSRYSQKLLFDEYYGFVYVGCNLTSKLISKLLWAGQIIP